MLCEKFYFKAPTTCLIIGGSNTGRTCLLLRILLEREHLFDIPPKRIIYTYVYEQPFFKHFSHFVQFVKFIPDDRMFTGDEHCLVVFDDMMTDQDKLKQILPFFTHISHYKFLSVIGLSQNLYINSNEYRTISLNTKIYCILTNSTRNKFQIARFGKDVFGDKGRALSESYAKCAKENYGYLIISLANQEQFPLRTHIFPSDPYEIVFVF